VDRGGVSDERVVHVRSSIKPAVALADLITPGTGMGASAHQVEVLDPGVAVVRVEDYWRRA